MILQGDALTVLRTLPAESVHCVVTSPPYWGLRDYGTASWVGGIAGCDHSPSDRGPSDRRSSTLGGGVTTIGEQERGRQAYRAVCGKCGATRIDSQLGLEATPELYVERMVDILSGVFRVLRKDGTLWLNLGDSYAATTSGNHNGTGATTLGKSKGAGNMLGARRWGELTSAANVGVVKTRPANLKPKDLVGIPWRVAFALQANGWYLRSDIIWSKPNPMPESVTDRPTKAHEYLFLLAKSERYYYDARAIAEVSVIGRGAVRNITPGTKGAASTRNDWDRFGVVNDGTRNKRSVWEIATQPYPEAHFATFPEALVEPCIKAGCPKDGVVLDPFAGSGTTLAVSKRLGREFIGIELNPAYITLIHKRVDRVTYEPELEIA